MQDAEIADPEPTSSPPSASARVRRGLGELVGLYWDSGISDDVPAMSWFLLSSLVPLALGITALAALALGDYAQAQAVAERVSNVLPKDVHDQVVQLILRTKRDSPLLIAGAIAGMLWTSSGIVGVLSRVLSRLLSLPARGILLGKLHNLGVTATVTVLIVMMVLVGSAGTGVVQRLDVNATVIRLLLPLLALVVAALICGGVYWSLTGRRVRYRSALAGGALAGLILLVTPTAAGYYLRLVAGRTPVELFLMLSGVLITCYLASFGLLLGAGVTARVDLGRRLTNPAQTVAPAST
jgi:membrane protein